MVFWIMVLVMFDVNAETLRGNAGISSVLLVFGCMENGYLNRRLQRILGFNLNSIDSKFAGFSDFTNFGIPEQTQL